MLKKQYLNIKINPKANKTIICFHGILSDAYSNEPIEEIADELNYNYISYTFPMHGNNHESILSIPSLIKISLEVIKLSPTKDIILFGHSAGANWVNQCLKYYGDNYFERIVLVAPINASLKFINLNRIRTLEKMYFIEKIEPANLLNDFKKINVLFKNYSYNEMLQYISLVLKLCNKKFLLSTNVVYEKTKTPILIIAGQNDIIIDSIESKKLFILLNSSIQYYILGGCGHRPHFEDKLTFKKLVKDFLQ